MGLFNLFNKKMKEQKVTRRDGFTSRWSVTAGCNPTSQNISVWINNITIK